MVRMSTGTAMVNISATTIPPMTLSPMTNVLLSPIPNMPQVTTDTGQKSFIRYIALKQGIAGTYLLFSRIVNTLRVMVDTFSTIGKRMQEIITMIR